MFKRLSSTSPTFVADMQQSWHHPWQQRQERQQQQQHNISISISSRAEQGMCRADEGKNYMSLAPKDTLSSIE